MLTYLSNRLFLPDLQQCGLTCTASPTFPYVHHLALRPATSARTLTHMFNPEVSPNSARANSLVSHHHIVWLLQRNGMCHHCRHGPHAGTIRAFKTNSSHWLTSSDAFSNSGSPRPVPVQIPQQSDEVSELQGGSCAWAGPGTLLEVCVTSAGFIFWWGCLRPLGTSISALSTILWSLGFGSINLTMEECLMQTALSPGAISGDYISHPMTIVCDKFMLELVSVRSPLHTHSHLPLGLRTKAFWWVCFFPHLFAWITQSYLCNRNYLCHLCVVCKFYIKLPGTLS